jgi:hypothetical protein
MKSGEIKTQDKTTITNNLQSVATSKSILNNKAINAAEQTCIIAETNTKYKSNTNADDKSKQNYKIRHNTNQEEVERKDN